MPRRRLARLSGYGDLMGRGRARWRRCIAEPAPDIEPLQDGDDPGRHLGLWRGRDVRFWRRKAMPSAIGSGRRKADVPLTQAMTVLMPQRARWAVRGSVGRERRSRRCSSRRRSAGRRR